MRTLVSLLLNYEVGFVPLAEELGTAGETVPTSDEVKATKVVEVSLVEDVDTELLEAGEGLFDPTAGQVRLKSGVVLSWEPTMPKLGLGVFG